MQMRLKNGTTFKIADYASEIGFAILLNSMPVEEVVESLTEDNLSEIRYLTDGGAVTGIYKNKLLCSYEGNKDTIEVRINDADLCRYGLTLDEDNRVVSAVPQRYALDNAIIVDALPDGDVSEYRYIDGEYIYDPLPDPEQPEEITPTQEERITALEAAMTAIEEGIASV